MDDADLVRDIGNILVRVDPRCKSTLAARQTLLDRLRARLRGEAAVRPDDEWQLLRDLGIALEFVRELAALNAGDHEPGADLIQRARTWLHTPAAVRVEEPLCLCSPLCGTDMCPIHATPELSVPLSAIRALVQQWEDAKSRASQKATDARKGRRESDELLWSVIASTTAKCLSELAALCPAPPEDRT